MIGKSVLTRLTCLVGRHPWIARQSRLVPDFFRECPTCGCLEVLGKDGWQRVGDATTDRTDLSFVPVSQRSTFSR